MSTAHKRLIAATLALSASLALAGCGPAADDSGPTTVTVMFPSSEFSEEQVEAFEADNPDITIEFIEFDEARLNAMITAGDPPDLVRGSPSANLFARGLAEPLDDFVANSDIIPRTTFFRSTTSGVGTVRSAVRVRSTES